MLGIGYFLKIAIPGKKKQFVVVAKISPAKHKKSPIRKNKLPQKFCATRYIYFLFPIGLWPLTPASRGFAISCISGNILGVE